MTDNFRKNIIDLIKRSSKILILPSSPPDGDSIGSALALYLVLKKIGKEATILCNDPIPELYHFLPHTQMIGNKLMSTRDFIITINTSNAKIKNNIEDGKINIIISPENGHISEDDITFNKGEVGYDLLITVDCGELAQLRDIYEKNIEIFQTVPLINIDHHISNTHFGKINYVDIMSSSTTELLLPLIEELARVENKELIDEDVATLLLTGIITDTGSFQNANTTPMAFERASELIAYGARQQEIIQYIYKTKQLSQLKLWGRILTKIQTDDKHKIVWSVASQQDFRDTNSSEDETGDIIDELMTNAPDAEVIILIKEKKDGAISASIRTLTPAVDASKIAEVFGGGGHVQAAGCRIKAENLREAEYKVIEAAKEFQAKRLQFPVEEQEPVEHMIEEAKEKRAIKSATQTAEKPRGEHKKEEHNFEPKSPFLNEHSDVEKEDSSSGYKFED